MSNHTDRNIKVPQDKSVYLQIILKRQDLAPVKQEVQITFT